MANKRGDLGRTGPGAQQGAVKAAKDNSPNRAFYLILAAIAIVGIAALGYSATASKRTATTNQFDPTLPPVKSEGYVVGNPQAPLEVIEFGDFECPMCAEFAQMVEPDVRTTYINTGKIRFRFIDFPLAMHANTWPASRAAACADEQGKFWQMHDLLYANQDQWNGEATRKPESVLKSLGDKIPGIDAKRFDKCVDNRLETQAKVQAHEQIAEDRKVNGTPTFVIGQSQFELKNMSFDDIKGPIDSALAALDTTKKKLPTKK